MTAHSNKSLQTIFSLQKSILFSFSLLQPTKDQLMVFSISRKRLNAEISLNDSVQTDQFDGKRSTHLIVSNALVGQPLQVWVAGNPHTHTLEVPYNRRDNLAILRELLNFFSTVISNLSWKANIGPFAIKLKNCRQLQGRTITLPQMLLSSLCPPPPPRPKKKLLGSFQLHCSQQ